MPAPEGMLKAWWSAWIGTVITLELSVRSMFQRWDQVSALIWPRLLPQPRNTIVPGRKILCVSTYAHVCMMWFDTEKDKRHKRPPIQRKGLRYIHLEHKIKEIEGEQMCAEDWGQKDRLSIYKRDCTSNFAVSPRLSHLAVHTQAQCLGFVHTDFISQSLFTQPKPS